MKRDSQALQAREHDLLVIGGGIAGAWTVWEAASRGLRAALIELNDFGQATSWSSLKTAHGGLRHLQRLDIAGFRESVRERRALLRVAPEIVRPLGFAIAAASEIERVKFLLGGLVNDALSFDRNEGVRTDRFLGVSRLLNPAEAEALAGPALAGHRAFVWQDAQVTHTERLLMGLLHAAVAAGASVINRCRVDQASRTDDGFELQAQDTMDGSALRIRTQSIVNAAGSGVEAVAGLLRETCGSPALIRGVNVVMGRSVGPDVAIGAKDQGRFLFIAPWLGRSILGTIYDDGRGPVGPRIDELIRAGARAFPWAGLTQADITSVHEGHVPGAENGEPVYRSRIIRHANPRVLSILTAKYTTARATAEQAVTRLGGALSKRIDPSFSASQVLPMATPLTGSFSDRLRYAEEHEMALDPGDALRGRLIEGAFGETGRAEVQRQL